MFSFAKEHTNRFMNNQNNITQRPPAGSYCGKLQSGHSFRSMGIWVIQYQQNFFPGSASTGVGSGRQIPAKNIIAPVTRIGRPRLETPIGTYKSVITKKAPKMDSKPPDATRPLYI